MRRVLALLAIAVITMVSCSKDDDGFYNKDHSPITREQAIKIMKKEIDRYEEVVICKDIVRAGSKILPGLTFVGDKERIAPYDSWLIIFDTDPLANGGQKFLYVYVDAYSGSAKTRALEYGYPTNLEFEAIKYIHVSYVDAYSNHYGGAESRTAETSNQASNNRAVIISGGWEPSPVLCVCEI